MFTYLLFIVTIQATLSVLDFSHIYTLIGIQGSPH